MQFGILAEKILNNPGLATDPKFSTNTTRVENREELVNIISDTLLQRDRDHWMERFAGLGWVILWLWIGSSSVSGDDFCSIPFGPINNIQETFQHPQVGRYLHVGSGLSFVICLGTSTPNNC